MLVLEFYVDDDRFLIPVTAVESIMAIPSNTAFIPRHDDIRVELFSHRGTITPLIDFNLLLDSTQSTRNQVITFLIDNRFFAFYITDVGSVLSVDSDRVTDVERPTSFIVGRCEISGKIYSLIDPAAIADRVRKSARIA